MKYLTLTLTDDPVHSLATVVDGCSFVWRELSDDKAQNEAALRQCVTEMAEGIVRKVLPSHAAMEAQSDWKPAELPDYNESAIYAAIAAGMRP